MDRWSRKTLKIKSSSIDFEYGKYQDNTEPELPKYQKCEFPCIVDDLVPAFTETKHNSFLHDPDRNRSYRDTARSPYSNLGTWNGAVEESLNR